MKEGSVNRIVSALAVASCALMFAAAPATALTFKKGEVLALMAPCIRVPHLKSVSG